MSKEILSTLGLCKRASVCKCRFPLQKRNLAGPLAGAIVRFWL